jgi:hypothetical protein
MLGPSVYASSNSASGHRKVTSMKELPYTTSRSRGRLLTNYDYDMDKTVEHVTGKA